MSVTGSAPCAGHCVLFAVTDQEANKARRGLADIGANCSWGVFGPQDERAARTT